MWRTCFPPDGANALIQNAYPAAVITLLRVLCVGRHLTESLQHHKTGARRATLKKGYAGPGFMASKRQDVKCHPGKISQGFVTESHSATAASYIYSFYFERIRTVPKIDRTCLSVMFRMVVRMRRYRSVAELKPGSV